MAISLLLVVPATFTSFDPSVVLYVIAIFGGPVLGISVLVIILAGFVKHMSVRNNPKVSPATKRGVRRRFLIITACILGPIALYWIIFWITLALGISK